jgi:hypothetical protein
MTSVALVQQHPAMPHVRTRLTRRGRVVLGALVVVPLMIGGAVFATNAGAAAGVQGSSSTFRLVTVHVGDSLWSIAQHVAPHVDPRDAIIAIADLNGLSSSVVQAGEQLAIPHQYDGSRR